MTGLIDKCSHLLHKDTEQEVAELIMVSFELSQVRLAFKGGLIPWKIDVFEKLIKITLFNWFTDFYNIS